MSDLTRLSRPVLEAMAACGREIAGCCEAWQAGGDGLLAQALAGEPTAEDGRHHPAGDVYDPASHAQYFYHRHAAGERGPDAYDQGEHGHFHIFLRARGMPPGMRPLVLPELAIPDNPAAPQGPLLPSAPDRAVGEDGDPWSHLVAIALDAAGVPRRLFTTNRWVTGETWYQAADVAQMLDRFALAEVPGRLVDRWIAAMLGLFRPQIIALLEARDAAVMGWRLRRRGRVHVFEDRRLEITSALAIDVEAQRRAIAAALRDAA